MFGDKFWNNVILEATHWKYTRGGIRDRLLNDMTEESWTKKFNDFIKEEKELNLGDKNLDSVFINTHYDATDSFCESAPNAPCTIEVPNKRTTASINTKYYSKYKFHEQSKKLIDWAKEQTPFHCKDIKIAQTEIDALNGELNSLKQICNKSVSAFKIQVNFILCYILCISMYIQSTF